jgi:hypothetical protein
MLSKDQFESMLMGIRQGSIVESADLLKRALTNAAQASAGRWLAIGAAIGFLIGVLV